MRKLENLIVKFKNNTRLFQNNIGKMVFVDILTRLFKIFLPDKDRHSFFLYIYMDIVNLA